jgi:hypothetical protein
MDLLDQVLVSTLEGGGSQMKMRCSKIESTATEVFARNGWRFNNRITF